jgi:hypothetical protein
VFVHTQSPPAAVRATQGSVGARVTLTWMTLRDFSEGVEEGKERTEEEVRHLPEIAGPHPRHLCRMMAQKRFPVLAMGLKWRASASSPSESSVGLLRISSLRSSPRLRCAPQSRLFAAISLINVMVSSESLGFLACTLDVCLQNRGKSSRWKPEKRRLSGPGRALVFRFGPSLPRTPGEVGPSCCTPVA